MRRSSLEAIRGARSNQNAALPHYGREQPRPHRCQWRAAVRRWRCDSAISDVNAGAGYATFSNNLEALETLDWNAIQTRQWQGKMSAKQAEFLLLDQFEWSSIAAIGCHNAQTADKVSATLKKLPGPHPQVVVENSWYY